MNPANVCRLLQLSSPRIPWARPFLARIDPQVDAPRVAATLTLLTAQSTASLKVCFLKTRKAKGGAHWLSLRRRPNSGPVIFGSALPCGWTRNKNGAVTAFLSTTTLRPRNFLFICKHLATNTFPQLDIDKSGLGVPPCLPADRVGTDPY